MQDKKEIKEERIKDDTKKGTTVLQKEESTHWRMDGRNKERKKGTYECA